MRKQRQKEEEKQLKGKRKLDEALLRSEIREPHEAFANSCRVVVQKRQAWAVISMCNEQTLEAFVTHYLSETSHSSNLTETSSDLITEIQVHGKNVQLKRRIDDFSLTDMTAHWDARRERMCLKTGVVKYWSEERGMGFITGFDQFNVAKGKQHGICDYFVHRSVIDGASCLEVGATVAFVPGFDSEKGKTIATEVKVPDLLSDEDKPITAAALAEAIDDIVLLLGLNEDVSDLQEPPTHWDTPLPAKKRSRPFKRFRKKQKEAEDALKAVDVWGLLDGNGPASESHTS